MSKAVQIIRIHSLDDPALTVYTNLNENQLRHYYEPQPEGLFIAESPTVIERALDAGYAPVSFLMEEKYIETECRHILENPVLDKYRRSYGNPIPVYVSTRKVLSQLTGYHLNRGILGAFRRKSLPTVEEVCQDTHRIVVLDNVENPTNVGAIFRSAAALGMDAVLVTPTSADPLQRRAIRVGVGTVFQIPWTYIGEDLTPAHARAMGLFHNNEPCIPRRNRETDDPGYKIKINESGYNMKPGAPGYNKNAGNPESNGTAAIPERDNWIDTRGCQERMVFCQTHQTDITAPMAGPDNKVGSDKPSGKVLTAAQLSEKIAVLPPAWPDRGIAALHRMGFLTVAMALREDTIPIDDARLRQTDKLAIILGNEGDGLPEQTLSLCDETIRIPMYHGVDSLNVAAASAVAFWELRKR